MISRIRWSRAPTARAVGACSLLFLLACSGAEAGADPDGGRGDASPAASGSPPATTPPVAGPRGPIDDALADRGEETFTVKGCIACHFVGREDRLVGPDLAGVTDRRSWGWFYAMVTNPDSMVQNDPEARQLFAQYMTPMSRQGLTDEEVQSVWEYLRRAWSQADGS